MTQPPLPYFPAPDGLRDRVRAAVRKEGRRTIAWRMTGLTGIAAALLLVSGTWFFGLRGRGAEAEYQAVLDGHLRSLAPGHLTDVASTDKHTVKPWFAGKLDFSPPVIDPAAEGFPLLGGRVDVMQGGEVAALVYSHRSHIINLFVRPADTDAPVAPKEEVRRGIDIVSWADGGMRFWAVSDLNLEELEQFRLLVTTPHPAVIVP